jgi:hypothetical protein
VHSKIFITVDSVEEDYIKQFYDWL